MRALAIIAAVAGCGPAATAPKPKPEPPAEVRSQAPEPPPAVADPDPAASLKIPPTSSARPGSMIAQITAPDMAGLAGALLRYLAATKTGAHSFISPNELKDAVRTLLGSRQLELAWDRPLALFVLAGSGSPRFVLASYSPRAPTGVDDDDHVHREGGVHLVGTIADIDAVRGYAKTLSISGPAIELAIFPDAVWGSYPKEANELVEELSKELGSEQSADDAQVAQRLVRGLAQIFHESARVVARLEIDGPSLELSMALEPRPGTALAAFGAAQKPADHGLFAHLPAGPWDAAIAGHVHLSPALAELTAKASLLEQASDDDQSSWRNELAHQLWDVVAGHAGHFAEAAKLGRDGSEVVQLIELRDAIAGARRVDQFAALTGAAWASSKEWKRAIERPRKRRGVMVRAMTVRATARKTRPWWFRYGHTRGYVFSATGRDSKKQVPRLIAAANRAAARKPAPATRRPPGLTAAFAASKLRSENVVAWFDGAGIVAMTGATVPAAVARASRGSGLVFGVAMSATSVGFRVTIPADQIGVLALAMP